MANRRDWLQRAKDEDMPESEQFRKRKYKKGMKKYKQTLRDHRRACALMK